MNNIKDPKKAAINKIIIGIILLLFSIFVIPFFLGIYLIAKGAGDLQKLKAENPHKKKKWTIKLSA